MRAAVLMPAHNEARLIESSVGAARGIPDVERVIVVDDGSTDGTGSRAAAAGATVVRLSVNVGKGAALTAGLAAIDQDTEALLLLDADLGSTASEGARLLDAVESGGLTMAVGILERPPGSGGLGLVKGLARAGISALGGGFKARAPLSGQRALTREAWEAATPFASGYGAEVALTIRALRAGVRVVEIPVAMRHAATGRDIPGFAHRGRQLVDVARTLVLLALERSRS